MAMGFQTLDSLARHFKVSTHTAWRELDRKVRDGILFGTADARLMALDARTGRRHVEAARVEGLTDVYASPVAAAGRLYIAGRDGAVAVLQQGPKLTVLATNRLDAGFDAQGEHLARLAPVARIARFGPLGTHPRREHLLPGEGSSELAESGK